MQHYTGHTTMGSFMGRGDQTIGKQPPTFTHGVQA